MELINKRLPRSLSAGKAALHAIDDETTKGIVKKYGDAAAMIAAFGIDRIELYSDNRDLAIERGVPLLVQVGRAYGRKHTTGLLDLHMRSAIIALGEMGEADGINDADVRNVARSLLMHTDFRRLTMASVLDFFKRLRCGELKVYGKLTGRKLLEAASEYAAAALLREGELRNRIDRERDRADYERSRRERCSWEEYCAMTGTPIDALGSLGQCIGATSGDPRDADDDDYSEFFAK